MQPDWDSVPDVAIDGRSLIQYPDPDPESTARMWAKIKAERAERKAAAAPVDDEDYSPFKGYDMPVVTQEAEEFDEPCRSLAGFIKLAHQNGWTIVEIAHTKSFAKGQMWASGEKAGTFRADRHMELQWLKASKEGVGRVLIAFPINNGKTEGTRVSRSFNGARYSDADMKSILRGDYNATRPVD